MAQQTTYTLRLVDKASATAKKIAGSFGMVTKSAKRAGDSINSVGFGIGLAAVTMGVRDLTRAADEQIQAETKVQQAVKSTQGAAGLSAKELGKIASELQGITTFGDEEILSNVTAQLLTFTKITGNEFEKAQKAVLNMSTVMGTDLRSSAIQLGKALNDPVANLGALGRAGIQFTESQKKVIKQLHKTGQTAKAQQIILKELNTQFGGQAEAAAKKGLGGWKQLQNTFGDIKEVIGKVILEAIVPLVEKGKALAKWARKNEESIKRFGKAILRIVPAVIALVGAIKVLNFVMKMNPIMAIVSALVFMAIHLDATAQKLGGWSNLFAAFGDLIDAVVARVKANFKILSNGFSEISDEFNAFKKLITGDINFDQYKKLRKAQQYAFRIRTVAMVGELKAAEKKIKDILGRTDFTGYLDETKGASKMAAMGDGTGFNPAIGLSPEAKKLQAQGITSGNIQSFNININTVNGINTLQTTNMEDGADQAGKNVLKAVMESIADIRPE